MERSPLSFLGAVASWDEGGFGGVPAGVEDAGGPPEVKHARPSARAKTKRQRSVLAVLVLLRRRIGRR
jgi:hypothetical protein